VQGYLIARPMAAEAIGPLLEKRYLLAA